MLGETGKQNFPRKINGGFSDGLSYNVYSTSQNTNETRGNTITILSPISVINVHVDSQTIEMLGGEQPHLAAGTAGTGQNKQTRRFQKVIGSGLCMVEDNQFHASRLHAHQYPTSVAFESIILIQIF